MKKCDCLLCKFENPKPSTAAIIIRDQKLLVAKRMEEPFLGEWDFFGGFVQKGETVEEAHKREIKEELGVESEITFLKSFPGMASFNGYEFPVLNHAYLTELKGEMKFNKAENSEFAWIPIKELKSVAYDSGKKILEYVKEKFTFDLDRVKELVRQLDPSATVNEQSLYKAMFDGHISTIEENGKLLGMGWIFPRQTLLRKQAVVEDLIVDESQRGKGYGEKIMEDLVQWTKKQGIEVVELTTNPKRLAANALYQKIGFKLHPTNHYLLDLR